MELRHIRYFLTLAEELHFGRAAQRLYISQPPLSRQIKELEAEIGAQLFTRDNKRVALTNAGKYFRDECQAILDQLGNAQVKTTRIHEALSGEINIGYISAIDKHKLALLIQDIQQTFPYLQTKLYELSTERQTTALINGKLDIGILRAPITAPQLEVEHLYHDTFCLAYARDFIIPPTFSELHGIPFITYNADYAPWYHHAALSYCSRMGFSPTIRHECNNISSILELVHHNIGISVVPQSVRKQYQHLAINFLALDNIAITTEIILAYPRERQHPAFTALQQFTLKHIKDETI